MKRESAFVNNIFADFIKQGFQYMLQEEGGPTTSWLGQSIRKYPQDLFIYQELIWNVRPDLIIECGTQRGGSAYFFGTILDMIGHGNIITIEKHGLTVKVKHPRVTYLTGNSTSPEIFSKIFDRKRVGYKILVSLDSNHAKAHVLKELDIYSQFVTLGSYLVVEDTHINGHPTRHLFGDGPMEAVEEWIELNSDFVIDKTCEKYYVTANPNGWLRRIE